MTLETSYLIDLCGFDNFFSPFFFNFLPMESVETFSLQICLCADLCYQNLRLCLDLCVSNKSLLFFRQNVSSGKMTAAFILIFLIDFFASEDNIDSNCSVNEHSMPI